MNSECPSNLACIQHKCTDPCPGSCGVQAECHVLNHNAICTCREGFSGDPFTICNLKPITEPVKNDDPCSPYPCGSNAQCKNGICSCLPDYQGDPYSGCQPECIMNMDCAKNKACIRNKCINPCQGTCATTAICDVINHIPMCSCPKGLTGNAFINCRIVESKYLSKKVTPPYDCAPCVTDSPTRNPCFPSPCGPNSQCKELNGQAVCSCLANFIGIPPSCRPECIMSSECLLTQACLNEKCQDPCPGSCGLNAVCQVVNHNPICSCLLPYIGDPFTRCIEKRKISCSTVDLCLY